MNEKERSTRRLFYLILFIAILSEAVIIFSGCLDSYTIDPGDTNATLDFNKISDQPDEDIYAAVADDDTSTQESDSPAPTYRILSGGGSSSSRSSSSSVSSDVSRVLIGSDDYTELAGTITGDLTITGNISGTITLPAGLTVKGDLFVNTPNATVYNYATVGGTVDIISVSTHTWYQFGDADVLQMKANNTTLYILSGNISNGILLLGNSTVVFNTSSVLPNVIVGANAGGSTIVNYGAIPLNVIASGNVTVAGNINVINMGGFTVTEQTLCGILSVSPAYGTNDTNVDIAVTYLFSENITDGTVNISIPEVFTVDENADYLVIEGSRKTIAGNTDAAYNGHTLTIDNVNIAKGQKIVLDLGVQAISDTGTYEFLAIAKDGSKVASNAASATYTSAASNDATLSSLAVSPGNLNPVFSSSTNDYTVNVGYDVSSINVTAILSNPAGSVLVNEEIASSGVAKSVELEPAGESTSITIEVTAEDDTTVMSYYLTVNRDSAPVTVTNAAIGGVSVPTPRATPVTTISETDQYTGTVTWSPDDANFNGSTVYTATITLTPKSGYTLKGVTEDFFTVDGATTNNSADSGVITAVFPATDPAVVNIAAIEGVTIPVIGGIPVTTINETDQYTGTVTWEPSDATFREAKIYTATITLTAKEGYTLTDVDANFFTVSGASVVTNDPDSGEINAVFPETDAVVSIAAIEGVTVPVTGETPVASITETDEYTGTVTWSPSDAIFSGDQVYTAKITLTPKTGYTLKSLGTNFFTVAGSDSATFDADSGEISVVFPATDPIVINIAAIEGVTVPATGAIPVTTINETDQYTGTVTWAPAATTFEEKTAYTATITLTPKKGYTLMGVGTNFFNVSGATATNSANSSKIYAEFPATDAIVSIRAIEGLTIPVAGEIPDTAINETVEYTGNVIWTTPAGITRFNSSTLYGAIINLTAKDGYTFAGIDANFFTVNGSFMIRNDEDSGNISIAFYVP